MNCSRDRDSFSRCFGRTVSSFPTLLSQRVGTPGSPYCSLTFSGYVRVMQKPFTPPEIARRNSWYDVAGVSSFTRYVDDLRSSGRGFGLGGSWISTRSVVAGVAPFAASLRLVPQLGQLIASGGTMASQNGQFTDLAFSGVAEVTETFTAGGVSAEGSCSGAPANRCPHCRHASVPGAAGCPHSGHSIGRGLRVRIGRLRRPEVPGPRGLPGVPRSGGRSSPAPRPPPRTWGKGRARPGGPLRSVLGSSSRPSGRSPRPAQGRPSSPVGGTRTS